MDVPDLRVGSACEDITPGPELDLLGYDFRQAHLPRGNAGVHDPLHVRALVIEQGGVRVAVAALDLCIVSVAFARRWRDALCAEFGLADVLIACTHTHSGPDLRLDDYREALAATHPAAPDGDDAAAAAYRERVGAALRAAVARAAGLTVPASAAVASAPIALAYGRRVVTPQGLRQCWNPQEQQDLRPAPTADPACSVLVLRQRGGSRRWLLWSLGAHPVGLGKTSRVVSADWPGLACARIARLLQGGDALFVLGACGDTHPWIATQEDPASLAPLADAAAGFVVALAQAAQPEPAATLRVARRSLRLGGTDIDLAAWRVGPALVAAAPVELFAQLGAELRARAAAPLVLATNAGGWTGYWPTRAAFAEGGYEIDAARAWGRQEGDGERLVEELAALLAAVDGDRAAGAAR